MYKFTKISKYLFLFFFLCSCGIGEALQGKKRSEQGDEFLIDKKNPLVLLPDFDELPIPGETNIKSTKIIENDKSNIKNLLKNNNYENISNTDVFTSIESSILKKIK